MRLIAPLLLATAGAAIVVALLETAGGDFSDWETWQAVAAPLAAFLVPALLTGWIERRFGVGEALLWAIACLAVQVALVFGVGFLVLDYGPD